MQKVEILNNNTQTIIRRKEFDIMKNKVTFKK